LHVWPLTIPLSIGLDTAPLLRTSNILHVMMMHIGWYGWLYVFFLHITIVGSSKNPYCHRHCQQARVGSLGTSPSWCSRNSRNDRRWSFQGWHGHSGHGRRRWPTFWDRELRFLRDWWTHSTVGWKIELEQLNHFIHQLVWTHTTEWLYARCFRVAHYITSHIIISSSIPTTQNSFDKLA